MRMDYPGEDVTLSMSVHLYQLVHILRRLAAGKKDVVIVYLGMDPEKQ